MAGFAGAQRDEGGYANELRTKRTSTRTTTTRRRSMFSSEGSAEYARVMTQSMIDPEFRERLMADPRTALGEQGITVPDDMVVSVRRGGGSSRLELALPHRPDMADEGLGGLYTVAADTHKTVSDEYTGYSQGTHADS
jgi:hypothetical protein